MSGLAGGEKEVVRGWFLGFGGGGISFDGVFVFFDSHPYVYRFY